MCVFQAEDGNKELPGKKPTQYTSTDTVTEIEMHKGIRSDLVQGEQGPFHWPRAMLSSRTFRSVGNLRCPVWQPLATGGS